MPAYTPEELKNYIWEVFEEHKDDTKRRKRPKRKAADKKEPHTSEQNLILGNLAKGQQYYTDGSELTADGGYYSYNGWVFIGSKTESYVDIYSNSKPACYKFYDKKYPPNFYLKYPRKKVNQLPLIQNLSQQSNADIKKYLKVVKFQAAGSGQVGQVLPYVWEAHHILPMSAFYNAFKKKHIDIILRSEYDINNGKNIIFLPNLSADRKYHGLPHHPSDHPNYTKRVIAQFNKIAKSIDKMIAQSKPHSQVRGKFEKDLHKYEKDNFTYVANYGKKQLS